MKTYPPFLTITQIATHWGAELDMGTAEAFRRIASGIVGAGQAATPLVPAPRVCFDLDGTYRTTNVFKIGSRYSWQTKAREVIACGDRNCLYIHRDGSGKVDHISETRGDNKAWARLVRLIVEEAFKRPALERAEELDELALTREEFKDWCGALGWTLPKFWFGVPQARSLEEKATQLKVDRLTEGERIVTEARKTNPPVPDGTIAKRLQDVGIGGTQAHDLLWPRENNCNRCPLKGIAWGKLEREQHKRCSNAKTQRVSRAKKGAQ
jgi:hypothetical protein